MNVFFKKTIWSLEYFLMMVSVIEWKSTLQNEDHKSRMKGSFVVNHSQSLENYFAFALQRHNKEKTVAHSIKKAKF